MEHICADSDDPYIDASTVNVSITGATQTGTGGKFEGLTISDTTALLDRSADACYTNLTLSVSPASVSEDGAHTVTYMATLTNAVREGDAPVTVTLSNNQSIDRKSVV